MNQEGAMDPNATLAEIREILARPMYIHGGWRLAVLVKALEDWLTSGGFLPDEWAPSRIVISRSQLQEWAGRAVSDEAMERLAGGIPYSAIPEAISTIVDSFEEEEDGD